MAVRRWWSGVRETGEREAVRPDLRRAYRATVSMMLPVGLAAAGWFPARDAVYGAMIAQALAQVDVRGSYGLRFTFLMMMLGVLVGATALGATVADNPLAAVAATGLMAINAGLWRYLSPEYGPAVAVPTGFVFLIAMSVPSHGGVWGQVESAVIGGVIAITLQVVLWPWRAQHPLRRAVAEAWVAAGELFEAMVEGDGERVAQKEGALREALDRGYVVLGEAGKKRPVTKELEEIHMMAGRLAMRVGGMRTAMEGRDVGGMKEVLETVGNVAQGVALALVSRQPAHLAAVEVGVRRAGGLLLAMKGPAQGTKVADDVERPAMNDAGWMEMTIDLVAGFLPEVGKALAAVTERAGERAVFPVELFDLGTWTLRPVAAVLNLRWKSDPQVLRFTLRLAVVLMVGVLVARVDRWPHGYWIPLTILVVSQPDYGATRKRAAERLLGTLVGGVLGSLLMRLHPSHGWAMVGLAVACFGQAYWLRRNYGLAVVCITVLVVMLTELREPVSFALTVERFVSTAVGGVIAMGAVALFWPGWERRQYRPVLAEALRASGEYVKVVADRMAAGTAYTQEDVKVKWRAERANAAAIASVARMYAEPANKRERVEKAAVIANGCVRLTRILSLMLLHAGRGEARQTESVQKFSDRAAAVLEGMAKAVEEGSSPPATVTSEAVVADGWMGEQVRRAEMEIDAMVIGVKGDGG